MNNSYKLNYMNKIALVLLWAFLIASTSFGQSVPVNPNASQSAKKILAYLWDLTYGTTPGVISGQNLGHGTEASWGENEYVEKLAKSTGKYVGMVGLDYEYVRVFTQAQLSQANAVLIKYWNDGGLVTINYTPRNPLVSNGDTRMIGGSLLQLLPNGDHRKEWLAKLDVIAASLKELTDNGVVVLWRPMQENNGFWFWYGVDGNQKKSDFIALWQDMYNYFTNEKGLNNLLWVYSPTGSGSFPYPGKDYVDIVGGTSYGTDLTIWGYNDYLSYGKVVGMGEYGWGSGSNNTVPQDQTKILVKLKNNYPKVAFWVSWHDWGAGTQADPHIYQSIVSNNKSNELMNDPYIITRDKLPDFRDTAKISVTGVVLSPSTVLMGVDATQQLTATVSPLFASNKNLSWSSDKPEIATVSPEGLVTAHALGSAIITVTSEDGLKTSECDLRVAIIEGSWVIHEDTESGWTSSGSANHYPEAQNSGASTWSVWAADASVQYTFTGSKIRIYGRKGSDMVTGNIYIDNVLVGSNISWNQTQTAYKQLVWESDELSNTSHTIKIVSTGDYIEIDYLMIFEGTTSTNQKLEKDGDTGRIFPNPADESCFIKINGTADVSVFNLLAEKVLQVRINQGEKHSLNTLKDGTYIVQVNENNSFFYSKMIVRR